MICSKLNEFSGDYPPYHFLLNGAKYRSNSLTVTILQNKNDKDGMTTNEICQKCREKLHGIYSFTRQHTESEKIFHQITDVTVRLKKLKSFCALTDFKTEFEAIAETDQYIDSPKDSSTVCDSSAVVKMECHSNFEDRFDFNKVTKDLHFGLLRGKYSNTTDIGIVEQKKIDSMGSNDADQISIRDEVIKEEWRIQDGDRFEANANHVGLDTEKIKFSYEMCDKPSDAGVEFKCDLCDAKYKTGRGLRDHKMSHNDIIFACKQCDRRFSNGIYLTAHVRRVHTDTLFSCDHCDATYKTKEGLNLHKRIIKGILFNCNQCDAKYKTSDSLRNHKMTHTGVTLPCTKCDASFSNKRNLKNHLRNVHTDSLFSCDHCDATYKRKESLNRHRRIINGRLFNCNQCDAKYKNRTSLIYHKKTHSGVTYACKQCNARFFNRRYLTRHVRGVHTDTVFSCDHCDATYKSKQGLNQHKQIINRIFNCDQCDAKLKTKSELRLHKMTHAGVTFACNKCDARFFNKNNLGNHRRRVHTNSVFSCDHCDATYKTKLGLDLHKQTVNGILFNCEECGKNFKRKDRLKRHKLSQHTNSENFKNHSN